jgi:hypothetical protein
MFIPSVLISDILETEFFEEIINHLSPNTLVCCDLDNTLIEASQQFGSVQWGDNYRRSLIESGVSSEEAEEIVHQIWMKMLPIITMRLVDTEAPRIIQNFQQKGCIVLGLTARYPEEAQYTHSQLNRVGIHFDNRYSRQKMLLNGPVLYEKGILFCGTCNKKGEALINFLKRIEFKPQKIVFIDDKLTHIKDLENILTSFNIDYVGIRFSKADKRVNEYDQALADLQWRLFPHFVTDEEAKQLLLKRKKIAFNCEKSAFKKDDSIFQNKNFPL